MRYLTRNIGLLNILTGVAFCLVVIYDTKISVFMFLYLIISALTITKSAAPFEELPYLCNAIYNGLILFSLITLMFSGFKKNRYKRIVCVVSSLLLFSMLFTPLFNDGWNNGFVLSMIIIFVLLNLMAITANLLCIYVQQEKPID